MAIAIQACVCACMRVMQHTQVAWDTRRVASAQKERAEGECISDVIERVSEHKISQQKQYSFMFRYFIEYNFVLMAVAHPLHCTLLFLLPFYTLNKNHFLCCFFFFSVNPQPARHYAHTNTLIYKQLNNI